jgi:hypothetical protein
MRYKVNRVSAVELSAPAKFVILVNVLNDVQRSSIAMSKQTYRPGSGWSLTAILRDLSTAWRLLGDPSVPALLKLALPFLALLYWIWPLDQIPGLPLDDIAIFLLAARLFVSLASSGGVNQAFGGRRTDTRTGQRPDESDVIDTTWRVVDK